ncbi:MAG: DEAD/DEAH box helicase [Planctomycetaceae bacterium]|nr:DEAD/DEAH box helicase [Planctomycetaceae bacterium]
MARKAPPQSDGGFTSLELDARLIEMLTVLGYEEPTPIQREAIPPILAGSDVIGQAATGTGKTAAFALPILQRIVGFGDKRGKPTVLVLVPTRELATQVAEAMHKYGRPLGVNVLPIYGGQAYGPQLRALKQGVDIVVATPGRALDHIRRKTMPLAGIRIVVLDEADEMLDMGFADDIESVLSETPAERQTVLVSATLPPRISSIAERHLKDPVRIRIAGEQTGDGELPRIRQMAYIVHRSHKPAALGRILDVENPTSTIVFCRTRTEVDELSETLTSRGYRSEPLHGGMSQDQRTRVMKKLRAGAADLIVATDVAARGLDIPQLSHVINYDVPNAPESYVHRIGRVGRAGREGVAITLMAPREHRMLRDFERVTKQKIETARVPTVADLHAKRLELTRASIREALLSDNLDSYRPVVESLCDEFDLVEIALAAIKIAHTATGADGDDAEEIPAPAPDSSSDAVVRRGAPRDGGGGKKFGGKFSGKPRGPSAGAARLYVAAGRDAGVRPQDLVGAIAAEAGLKGRDVGAIEIADRFSLVEVPEADAEKVIKALRAGTIRGKKVAVRRDQREG